MKKRMVIGSVVVTFVALFITVWILTGKEGSGGIKVKYGITPYQDSALPVVAEILGWYQKEGLNVELIPLSWGEVVTGLSSEAIDVAIYNFNSFMPAYHQAAKRSPVPIVYVPVFAFKGQAIMVHGNVGWKTIPQDRGIAIQQQREMVSEVVKQMKGKRVAVTKGTELEQIVEEALTKGGLKSEDVTIIHASPADGLAAFLSGDVDVFAAGLTERIEAEKRGAIPLLTAGDVMPPVIDGIVTTERFLKKQPETLQKLVDMWFRTIRYIEKDIKGNSKEIRDYLAKNGSTVFTPAEYEIAWSFDIFPKNREEANNVFNNPESILYWKRAWDGVNEFLINSKNIDDPVPYSAYLGEQTLSEL